MSAGMTIPRRPSLLGRARRRCAGMVALAAGVALAGCGATGSQTAGDPSGNFEVAVTSVRFPTSQRLSEHTHMVIVVRNAGARTIPDIVVTICNVTCRHPAPPGEGSSAQAFGADLDSADVGNPSRPTWIVDRAPGVCDSSCQAGGPGSGVTAYSNTWALGALAPGQVKSFEWALTAVSPGRHVVAWVIAAALSGNAKAVLADGSTPHGALAVTVHSAPARSYVSDSGRIVNSP